MAGSTQSRSVYRETIGVNEEDMTAPADMVKSVKRFNRDLDALLRLGSNLTPPEQLTQTGNKISDGSL
eukprot:14552990-Ditylum_brightwellii.AAC.1